MVAGSGWQAALSAATGWRCSSALGGQLTSGSRGRHRELRAAALQPLAWLDSVSAREPRRQAARNR